MAFRILFLLSLLQFITRTASLLWYHSPINHIPHCYLLCTAIISDLLLGTDMPTPPWQDAADVVEPL